MNISYNDIRDAFLFMFGKRIKDFGVYLIPDALSLRKTFYLQALHWHPDRVMVTGNDSAYSVEMFKKIHSAYEVLKDVAGKKVKIIPRHVPERKSQSGSNSSTFNWPYASATFWNKWKMPNCRVRFAQYLFYKGVIDWNTIIDALVWQKKNRPRVGQIGLDFGYFEESTINFILSNRSLGLLFCRAAVELGFISNYQSLTMIGRQKQFNAPIGRFFTERGILSPIKLQVYLNELANYNYQYSF